MPRQLTWLCLIPLCACEASAGSSLNWSVRFANPQTAAEASSVQLSILEGSCSSPSEVYSAWVTRDATGRAPPKLKPGGYALRARATSARCSLIAYGCVQTRLPGKSTETIEIVLDDVPVQPFCAGDCSALCDLGDGGKGLDNSKVPDATPDGSPLNEGGLPPADAGGMPNDGGDAPLPCDGTRRPAGRCYRFNSTSLTFDAAEAECITWGGHLVSFNDAAEELWVTEQTVALGSFGNPIRFWIGFTDSNAEGLWQWLDGSSVGSQITFNLADPGESRFKTTENTPYTHWGPNPQTTGNSEPNNGNGDDPSANPGEDCAESRADRSSGPGGITSRPEWDDSACASTKRSVCERE